MDLNDLMPASNATVIHDNMIYLNGDITPETAHDVFVFITQANMEGENIPSNLVLFINSPGGCMESTMSMVGAMRASKIPVYTIATGSCMSGGLMLAMAGHKRFVDPYCNVMSHTLSTGFDSAAKHSDLKIWLKNVKSATKQMIRHYMECTLLSKEQIKKELLPKNGEVYLTAEEAIEYNMFDDTFTSYDQVQ